MIATTHVPNVQFYREWQMIQKLDPKEYGVDIEKEEFVDILVNELAERFHGLWTVDELLLHPRDAMRFCDDVRHKHGFLEVPDQFLLRCMINRRKNPNR